MPHIKTVTVRSAVTGDKGLDPAGAVFFQIWLAVFTWIISGAFSSKD